MLCSGLVASLLCDLNYFNFELLRDFRLPPLCKLDLRSFAILRSVEWYFRIDVSGHPIGPIFKGQTFFLDCLATILRCVYPERAQISDFFFKLLTCHIPPQPICIAEVQCR